MKIQDIKNTLLQFAEGDAPATPDAGAVKIYAKADGKIYSKDDTGAETALGGGAPEAQTKAISFYIDDVLAVETSAMSVIVPFALAITEIRLAVDVAPTGADLILDIHKNGTTLYTTQANRPTVAAGNTSATATDPDVTSLVVGDILTLDIDQIGSTIAGSNLAVTIICEVV